MMTTVGPPDQWQHERSLSRSETQPFDNTWSNHPTGRQVDGSVGSGDTDRVGMTIETDGGLVDRDVDHMVLRTYTDDDHGYSLAYPAGWTVEPDLNGGATFEAFRSTAGVAVFVEEGTEATPEESVTTFFAELDADESVHALELLAQRDVQLESGQTGWIVECAYAGDSHEQWRLAYLFVCTEDTDYTLGIDWNAAAELEECTAAILKSFTLQSS